MKRCITFWVWEMTKKWTKNAQTQNFFFSPVAQILVHSIPPNQFSLYKNSGNNSESCHPLIKILVRDDLDPETWGVIFFSQWNVSLHQIVVDGNSTLCVRRNQWGIPEGKHLRWSEFPSRNITLWPPAGRRKMGVSTIDLSKKSVFFWPPEGRRKFWGIR